jgi:ABC-2 type transport system permease protein
MSLYLGASYLLTLFVPMLGWPDWLNRLSIFWAMGRPYLDWPTPAGLLMLLILAVGGALLAVLAQERRPVVSWSWPTANYARRHDAEP